MGLGSVLVRLQVTTPVGLPCGSQHPGSRGTGQPPSSAANLARGLMEGWVWPAPGRRSPHSLSQSFDIDSAQAGPQSKHAR